MPGPSIAKQLSPDDDLKNFSCLSCRQRKVKCDRHSPCSNCVRAEKECSFIPPVRGKRKRTKPHREGLHAKLRRYEELLKSHGTKIEPSDEQNFSETETENQTDVESGGDLRSHNAEPNHAFELENAVPKLITEGGTSKYFERGLWSNLGDEFRHPELGADDDTTSESENDDTGLFFEPKKNYKLENLSSLHFPTQMLPKLKDIFLERVDPLIKILHIPTFWTALTNGLQNPQDMSKSLEATIFAFYLATITTLKDDECQNLFRTKKTIMCSRYRLATRQALLRAGFVSTSSPMTLGAYALYMMCIRGKHQSHTLYIYSGIAVRLALRMGLHRDGLSLGLTPFDTEMRRRLWTHLVHVDYRTADVLGARPSLDLSCGDTKMPSNLADEDLHPGLTELPPECKGVTHMTFSLIKCEIMEAFRRFETPLTGDVRWEVLSSSNVTLERKESVIDQIEDVLERKYLRYCDPTVPLHIFISIVIRSSICMMKLFTYNPRQFANNPVNVTQNERNIVFENAMKLLEYLNLMQGHPSLEKYTWHTGTSYLWNTMLYVLIGIRHRIQGPEVERAWQLIGEVFTHYPQMYGKSPGPVYVAIGKWTLEVWAEYAAAFANQGLSQPVVPEYIDKLRLCRGSATKSQAKPAVAEVNDQTITQAQSSYNKVQFQKYDETLPPFDPLEYYDFPNLISFEMDPNEWNQWEQLVADQANFWQND